MKQINNGYLPCYWIDEKGQVYNEETGRYLRCSTDYTYRLKKEDNSEKRITIKSLYFLVYGKQFAIDNIENLPDEEWKEIENTKGQYFVSNKGRVKSYARINAKILKENRITGYSRVDIMYDKCRSSMLVHRLVAQYFLEQPKNINCELHHRDFNTFNNNADNLQWLDKQEHYKLHKEARAIRKENK